MRFTDCLFDLYGTLVDIHTDESSTRFGVKWPAGISATGQGMPRRL